MTMLDLPNTTLTTTPRAPIKDKGLTDAKLRAAFNNRDGRFPDIDRCEDQLFDKTKTVEASRWPVWANRNRPLRNRLSDMLAKGHAFLGGRV